MSKERPSFLLYKSFYDPIKYLKDEELGLLFRAIFDYQNGNEVKGLPPQSAMAFAFFMNQFRLDEQKYQVVIDRNKSNGSKGGRPKKIETQVNPKNPMGFEEPKKPYKEKEKEIDKEIDKEIEEYKKVLKKKPKGFVPPSLKDVQDYCKERNNSVNPEKWISHYQSNGWKVGKNSMKDWKAAVRTWEGNSFNSPKPQSKHNNFEDQDYYANTEGFEVC
jgi:hypothetical protein